MATFVDMWWRWLIEHDVWHASATALKETAPTVASHWTMSSGDDLARQICFVVCTFVLLEAVFWGTNGLLFGVVYRVPWFQRYKIPHKQPPPDKKMVRECLRDIMLNHFLLRPPVLWLLFPYIAARNSMEAPLPSGATVVWQIVACMLIDDTFFYWSHRLLHHPRIYKYIHKQHHAFKHSIGIAVEYAHPVEDLLSNAVSTAAGPIILGSHMSVLWLYFGLKLHQSIDAHSGYDLPFPLSPWSAIVHGLRCSARLPP